MNDDMNSEVDDRAPYFLTYARASDPQIAALEALLTATEANHLHHVLDRLADVGAVVVHDLDARRKPATGVKAVLQKLRSDLGSLMVDACADAAAFPYTSTPRPKALIPVWSFEPDPNQLDRYVADGLLFGAPVTFEALRVDDDHPCPMSSITARLRAWRSVMSSYATIGTVSLPGREGTYALFAWARAS